MPIRNGKFLVYYLVHGEATFALVAFPLMQIAAGQLYADVESALATLELAGGAGILAGGTGPGAISLGIEGDRIFADGPEMASARLYQFDLLGRTSPAIRMGGYDAAWQLPETAGWTGLRLVTDRGELKSRAVSTR